MRYYESYCGPDDRNKWHTLAENALRHFLRPGMKVGELGCGSGTFLKYMCDSYQLWGVGFDLSPENVHKAQRLGLATRQLDFSEDDWGIDEESFDVLVSCEVIEHLLDPRRFMINSRKLLREGGVFLISTPNAFNIKRRAAFLMGRHHDPLMDPARVDFAEHIRAFSFHMLETLARGTGYEVIKSVGDRVLWNNLPGMASLRSLLSSHICLLLQRRTQTVGQLDRKSG